MTDDLGTMRPPLRSPSTTHGRLVAREPVGCQRRDHRVTLDACGVVVKG